MDPDQEQSDQGPHRLSKRLQKNQQTTHNYRSSLIRVDIVCFYMHHKKMSEVNVSMCSRRSKQTTFQDKNICGLMINNL